MWIAVDIHAFIHISTFFPWFITPTARIRYRDIHERCDAPADGRENAHDAIAARPRPGCHHVLRRIGVAHRRQCAVRHDHRSRPAAGAVAGGLRSGRGDAAHHLQHSRQEAAPHPHVWKLIATHPDACVPIKGNVFALHPFHAWAQLSSHVSLEELVILAEAIITAISKSSGRYPRLVLSSLREFIDNAPYFLGKTACRTALQLVKANVLSPKESKARLVLLRHGLPDAEVNCHVDRAMFDSGKPMSLDIAWKHFKVAVEYDGDHHRTDKHQWRRDRKKRDRLRQLGWTIIVITADDIRDEVACAEFALNVARELTLRGCDVDFRVIAMTVEELARREKAADRKKRRESAV